MLIVKAKGVFCRRPHRELQMEVTLLPESQQSISITTQHGGGGRSRADSRGDEEGVKSTLSAHLKR